MTFDAMQGLEYNKPTEISTTFAAAVTTSTWRVNEFGLVADVATPADGGVDRYFVPWSQLKYAKQHIPPVAP